MSDYQAWADDTAAKMRSYYDAHRPLTIRERIFGRRSTAHYWADDLMLGLLDVALNAFAKREPDPRVLEPYHLGERSPK